MLLVTNF